MNDISEGCSMPKSEFLLRIFSCGQSLQNIKCVARDVNILCLTGLMLKWYQFFCILHFISGDTFQALYTIKHYDLAIPKKK